jgi:hypothetical protein
MESTPLSTRSDREGDKEKRKRFEVLSEEAALRHSRHIAREALRHEEDDRDTEEEGEEDEESVERIAHRAFESRKRAPEAKQLHGEEESRIGHMLIAAEADRRRKEDSRAGSAPEKIELPSDKRIETLSRSELLSLSQQIIVESASLRDVYETHLIGEQALRRLIAEYLHGGDIQKALQREILEHEIDFERDPALRDMAVPADEDNDDSRKVAAPAKETLNQLLQKAGAGIFGSDEELTYHHNHDHMGTDHKPQQSTQRYQRQRQSIDIIMWGTIVVLVILVIALFFWHH